jgi:hypothetical protein
VEIGKDQQSHAFDCPTRVRQDAARERDEDVTYATHRLR